MFGGVLWTFHAVLARWKCSERLKVCSLTSGLSESRWIGFIRFVIRSPTLAQDLSFDLYEELGNIQHCLRSSQGCLRTLSTQWSFTQRFSWSLKRGLGTHENKKVLGFLGALIKVLSTVFELALATKLSLCGSRLFGRGQTASSMELVTFMSQSWKRTAG